VAKQKRRLSNKSRRAIRAGLRSESLTEAKTIIAKKYHCIPIVIVSAIVASIFHFSLVNIPDLDSFYYIRLAWLYRTRGLFDVDFPWMQYSVIKNLSSSLWYGFGLFLIPFSYFNDLVIGIKVAGAVLTTVALSLYYWVMKREKIKLAFLWPFLLFFSAPNVLAQFLMTRPQLLSLALSPLLFSLLINRPGTANTSASESARTNFGLLLLTSFGLVWFHLNFVWLVALVLAVTTVTAAIVEKKSEWKPVAAVASGALLGLLARPNPLGAAQLLYIQVVEQFLVKQSGLTLVWGRENLPLSLAALVQNFIPFMFLWVLAILLMARFIAGRKSAQSPDRQTFLWSSLALSLIFFLLTMFVGRRSYNLWVEFGVIFIAGVYTYIGSLHAQIHIRNAGICVIVGVFIFVASDSTSKSIVSIPAAAPPPDMLKDTALWLKENSQPGDIVFNATWNNFSPLFYWNQHNRYVGGLDPIFQYAYDRKLYWKFHHLAVNPSVKQTCAAAVCTKEILEDTYEVLVRDFKAKYVVTGKQRPWAYYLKNDARFAKKLETEREVIYIVK
jgi:hypothetical protein